MALQVAQCGLDIVTLRGVWLKTHQSHQSLFLFPIMALTAAIKDSNFGALSNGPPGIFHSRGDCGDVDGLDGSGTADSSAQLDGVVPPSLPLEADVFYEVVDDIEGELGLKAAAQSLHTISMDSGHSMNLRKARISKQRLAREKDKMKVEDLQRDVEALRALNSQLLASRAASGANAAEVPRVAVGHASKTCVAALDAAIQTEAVDCDVESLPLAMLPAILEKNCEEVRAKLEASFEKRSDQMLGLIQELQVKNVTLQDENEALNLENAELHECLADGISSTQS